MIGVTPFNPSHMTTWIAVISNDLIPDYIKEIEIEADDHEQAGQALERTIRASGDLQNFSAVTVRKKRGGARPGAGRKKGTQGTYGCETKVVRVPVDIAPELPELLTNIGQLKELLTDWEEEASKSTSPRYDRARKLISEIRALGF